MASCCYTLLHPETGAESRGNSRGGAEGRQRGAPPGNHAKREYCVQYRESDLDVVARLLEESGIFYFFEHEKGTHTLVLGDAIHAQKDEKIER